MCLSTVYKGGDPAPENQIAEYVTAIDVDGGALRLTGITGEEVTVRGAIRFIDLIAGRVYIDPEPTT